MLGVLRAADRAALASYVADGARVDTQVLKEVCKSKVYETIGM